MPTVVDYPLVLSDQVAAGLRSLYHNSGAFGFPAGAATTSFGWVGPPDETIREAARPLVRPVDPPEPATLAQLLVTAWADLLPGELWVMPKAHWAYELDFGSKAWLPEAVRSAGVDPTALAGRNNGTAVAFAPSESAAAAAFVAALLTHLVGSDFAAAWPGRRVACTIHSHRQIWWTTDDPAVIGGLDRLVPRA